MKDAEKMALKTQLRQAEATAGNLKRNKLELENKVKELESRIPGGGISVNWDKWNEDSANRRIEELESQLAVARGAIDKIEVNVENIEHFSSNTALARLERIKEIAEEFREALAKMGGGE